MITFILVKLVDLYSLILIIYCLLSWIPMGSSAILEDVRAFFGKLCDPLLDPIRKIIPPVGGMVDLSPIVLLLVLECLVRVIAWIL